MYRKQWLVRSFSNWRMHKGCNWSQDLCKWWRLWILRVKAIKEVDSSENPNWFCYHRVFESSGSQSVLHVPVSLEHLWEMRVLEPHWPRSGDSGLRVIRCRGVWEVPLQKLREWVSLEMRSHVEQQCWWWERESKNTRVRGWLHRWNYLGTVE